MHALQKAARNQSFTPVAGGILQRKCACGAGKKCEKCDEEPLLIQRAARNSERATGNSEGIPPIVHEVLRSPGEPLDAATRAFFEPRFGHDFSQVRIHADTRAGKSAQAINALAYTLGSDIVFGAGSYSPETTQGKRVLAHELAHTIQQTGRSGSLGQDVAVSAPNEPWELEAESASSAAIAGRPVMVRFGSVQPLIARQPSPRPIPGPSPTLPQEEEKKKEDFSDVGVSVPQGGGATWGWGAPETNNIYQNCLIPRMPRDRYLAFEQSLSSAPKKPARRTQSGIEVPSLGITFTKPYQAKPPEIGTTEIKEGNRTVYKLKPTHAEMPPIRSGITQAGSFVEGTVASTDPGCAAERARLNRTTGRAVHPVNWNIDGGGEDMIRLAEREHCNDIRYAFDITLGLYASAINNVAAAERTYDSEKQAEKDAVDSLRYLKVDPGTMLDKFAATAAKTEERDSRGFHTPKPNSQPPSPTNGCKAIENITATSGPEIGKHPSSEIIQ